MSRWTEQTLIQRLSNRTSLYFDSVCRASEACSRTFYVNLSRRRVCAIDVGGEAGISPCVLLEGFGDGQRVQVSGLHDVNVWGVFELFTFTIPPARRRRTRLSDTSRKGKWPGKVEFTCNPNPWKVAERKFKAILGDSANGVSLSYGRPCLKTRTNATPNQPNKTK